MDHIHILDEQVDIPALAVISECEGVIVFAEPDRSHTDRPTTARAIVILPGQASENDEWRRMNGGMDGGQAEPIVERTNPHQIGYCHNHPIGIRVFISIAIQSSQRERLGRTSGWVG